MANYRRICICDQAAAAELDCVAHGAGAYGGDRHSFIRAQSIRRRRSSANASEQLGYTWGVPLAVAVTAWSALWIGRLAPDGWRRARASRRPLFLAAGLGFRRGGAGCVAPDGYLYLHILLLSIGLVLATEAVELARLPTRARHAAIAVSLLTLPSLVTFPSSLQARELLAFHQSGQGSQHVV